MTKITSSCNGCKVLRKGCNENCTIRPCLRWIEDPDSQANATVFLTKFYGRTGLINLIDSGPEHLRPALFRSLLYEACGRIVNPTFGSVGLLWSGKWHLCQAAVEAVLRGEHIAYISVHGTASVLRPTPSIECYDFGCVSKESRPLVPSAKLHTVNKAKSGFKPSLSSIRFLHKNMSSTLMESLLGAMADNSVVSQTGSNWIDQMGEEKKRTEIDLSLGLAPPTLAK